MKWGDQDMGRMQGMDVRTLVLGRFAVVCSIVRFSSTMRDAGSKYLPVKAEFVKSFENEIALCQSQK